jgi:hypothetical protein
MKDSRPRLILLIVQKQAQMGICACFSAKVRSIYAQPPLNAMLLRSQKTGEKTGGALMPLSTFIWTGIDLPKTEVLLYFSLALRRIWYRMSLLVTVIFCSCKGYPEDAPTDELSTKSLESLSRAPLRAWFYCPSTAGS